MTDSTFPLGRTRAAQAEQELTATMEVLIMYMDYETVMYVKDLNSYDLFREVRAGAVYGPAREDDVLGHLEEMSDMEFKDYMNYLADWQNTDYPDYKNL